MYRFSKNKFLGLPATTQASKLALLLKRMLESPTHKRELLDEYQRYLSWMKPSLLPLDIKDLHNQYHHWNRISGYNRGFIGTVKAKDRPRALKPPIPWKVAVNSLRSGYNVGSIFRTADAFGLSGVILGGKAPSGENRAVRSAAMGAETWMKQLRRQDLLTYLHRQKKTNKVQLVGLELSRDSVPLEEFQFSGSGILILGNEEQGIEPHILQLCDQLVNIPMSGRKHSLNVAAAFAIAAYHIRLKKTNMAQ